MNEQKPNNDLKQFKVFKRFGILQTLLVLALLGIVVTIVYELVV